MKRTLLLLLVFQLPVWLASAQTLLYDQTDSVGTGGILCRTHTTTTSQQFDTEGADDFTIPTGEVWKIDSIVTQGFYNATAPSATPTRVTIYEDSSGQPGSTVVYTNLLTDGDPDDDGDLEPHLTDQPAIGSGTYWISMGIHTSSVPWYWARIPQLETNSPTHWKNPGGGYNVCTDWTPLYTCITSVLDSSLNFEVWGCVNPPQLDPLPEDTILCDGESITLSASTSTSGVSFEWSTGATSQSIQVDSSGLYEVTVTNTATGCGRSTFMNVDYISVPEPSIDDDTICANSTVPSVFGPITGCNNCLITWSDGSHSQFFSTQDPGWIWVTVEDTIYGCSETDSAFLTVENTEATIAQGDPIDLCEGDSITVSIFEPFSIYEWKIYDGLNWNVLSTSSTANVSIGGTLVVTATTEAGCIGRDTSEVIERPAPQPAITFINKPNGNVELLATVGYQAYAWSNGGTNSSTIVSSNGIYTVTVTDEYGCEGEQFINVFTVGTDETSDSDLRIYPNPARDQLTISLPSAWSSNAELTILSADGREVATQKINESISDVDLSGLATGIYYIKLDVEGGQINSKLIVTK